MQIFRHLLNYNELKPTIHFLFFMPVLEKVAMVFVLFCFSFLFSFLFLFLHDSIGSLSSKLERNGSNHHALSHAKFICFAVLKSCNCFSSCTLERVYGKIKLFFFLYIVPTSCHSRRKLLVSSLISTSRFVQITIFP